MKFLLGATLVFAGVSLYSCQGKWTEDDKKSFIGKCDQMGPDSTALVPKGYCECTYEETSKRYPNPNITVKRMTSEDFELIDSICKAKLQSANNQ